MRHYHSQPGASAMSSPIIAAVRQQHQLKESVLHTAQELAHRASIYGVAKVSYSYLAQKCHCCRQTIINHIKKLIDLKIIRKSVIWIKGNFCEVNTYHFLLDWDQSSATKGGSKKSVQNLPPLENTQDKWGGIEEEINTLTRGLRFCTPGSDAYVTTQEKIERLREMLPPLLP